MVPDIGFVSLVADTHGVSTHTYTVHDRGQQFSTPTWRVFLDCTLRVIDPCGTRARTGRCSFTLLSTSDFSVPASQMAAPGPCPRDMPPDGRVGLKADRDHDRALQPRTSTGTALAP